MSDLRALVEDLGYREVRTLLNSGNVVFSASRETPSRVGARIEKAMIARLGVSARVWVLAAADFGAVVAENTLTDVAKDPARLLVAFIGDPLGADRLSPLAGRDWSPEALAIGSRAAYLWCPSGILGSRLPEAVGRALGDSTTTRNWTTVTKIHAMIGHWSGARPGSTIAR